MYLNDNPSIEDNIKLENNYEINKKYIFREYLKINDNYIATNNFYISDEIDKELSFNIFDINNIYKNQKNNEKIIPYNNYIYLSTRDNIYIDLIIISNISFTLDDTNIDKNYILKKIIEFDEVIDDKLLDELYLNEDFCKKKNIKLPSIYNDKKHILNNSNIVKKYLFKINFLKLTRSFYIENSLI